MRNSYYKKHNVSKLKKNKFGNPIFTKEDCDKWEEELLNNTKLIMILKQMNSPRNQTS